MQCLNFNYSLLGVSVNVFRNLFLIFDLDMQHPVLLENYRCLSSYGSLLPLVLVYTHVCVGAFTRTPFFRSCLVDSTLQQKEHLWDVWLYFPGTKVGPNWSLFFLFDYLVALIMNRYRVRLFQAVDWDCFLLWFFVYSERVHCISHLYNDCRLGLFLYLTTLSVNLWKMPSRSNFCRRFPAV
jgi:hypothetical protein